MFDLFGRGVSVWSRVGSGAWPLAFVSTGRERHLAATAKLAPLSDFIRFSENLSKIKYFFIYWIGFKFLNLYSNPLDTDTFSKSCIHIHWIQIQHFEFVSNPRSDGYDFPNLYPI